MRAAVWSAAAVWGVAAVWVAATVARAQGGAEAGGRAEVMSVEVPAGEREVLRAEGRGVQVYRCDKQDAVAGWVFVAPEAKLYMGERVVGTHAAGPVWRHEDGSAVLGEVLAKANSTEADAVPLLLLRARSHEGNDKGVLAGVNFVQRLETRGGAAPESGCDAERVGTLMRAPYTAVYVFWAAR